MKKVWLLPLLALLFIGLVIWFAGPYFAFADYALLESVTARLIAIGLVVAIWGAKLLVKELQAARAGHRLAGAVIQQDNPATAQTSVDVRQLQQRFTEAIEALQGSRKNRTNLYNLPWYVIIGPPGAGKTTAIVNSGLNFPLEQKFGKGALRGVGGTRNCDWWFTDRAILLDTAGRYTTQDSEQHSDAAGWKQFLTLLRKYRRRRPLNGVLVAISLAELLTQTEAERARHVAAIRQRLDELHRELAIQLPVYVVLTKCDLLAGFREFFDGLSQEGREQVWGTTFTLDSSRDGSAFEHFDNEFSLLLERLNARMLARMDAERDVQRRALIFGFPRQFAGARRLLKSFLGDTFGTSAFEQSGWLRGVYFTSGTQEGTPIDRMLGALAVRFGLGVRAVNTQGIRGRSYFIHRLLGDVMIAESGLAGINRRIEARQALVQTGAYVAVATLFVLGLCWFAVSYGRNRAHLQDVQSAAAALTSIQAAAPDNMTGAVARLDAYREVLDTAEKHEKDGVPFSMRAGLYRGGSVARMARDAYLHELNASLAPATAVAVHDRLLSLAGEPDKLYEYLKVYLMLGSPERLAQEDVQFIADLEWRRQFAADPTLVQRLNTHVTAWVADKGRIEPVPLDDEVIQQARSSLRQASVPVLMYASLKPGYLQDGANAIHLDKDIGLGGNSVFVRKSGTPLSAPIPALYTRKVFTEVAATGKYEVANEFVADSWVLGEGTVSKADIPRLAGELMRVYEDDYIQAWDQLLADLTLRPTHSSRELADMMALLASPTSPLKRLLVIVEANTNLMKPTDPNEKVSSVKAAIAEKLRRFERTFGVAPAAELPGSRVTAHFETINKLIDGPQGSAPVEQTLAAIGAMQKRLAGTGSGLGKTDGLAGANSQDQASALESLRVATMQLPAPVASLVSQVGAKGAAAVSSQASQELARRYETEVFTPCSQLVAGHYPFVSRGQATDITLADFASIFAPGGVFDTFMRTRLEPLVDTTREPWRWKEGAARIGSSVPLAQFQSAQQIRQIYFPSGSPFPQVRFTLTPQYLDRGVEHRAQRLVLNIDGQTVQYRYDSPRAETLVWPGPLPGQASLAFEEDGGGGPARTFQGPWALFHLLDSGALQPQSDIRYLVTFAAGPHNTGVTLEGASVRNPFAHNVLREFRCGG